MMRKLDVKTRRREEILHYSSIPKVYHLFNISTSFLFYLQEQDNLYFFMWEHYLQKYKFTCLYCIEDSERSGTLWLNNLPTSWRNLIRNILKSVLFI